MNDSVEQIKSKLDIADFLKGYVRLLPAGKNFKALCPFHKEKTPSFMVSPDRQSWHCFGSCNTGGDIFAFLMRYENIEFFEALKVLAEKAGIELKRLDPVQQRQFGVLYDLNSAAKEFFKGELSNAASARDYLQKRGLAKETIEEFEIGFAPNQADALTLNLINKGFAVADIDRSGLAHKSERGKFYDLFRGRIMFPIANHFGRTVGFTGRILPEFDEGTMGKYVNSPETPIFKKSKIIYGFHKTKNAIRESGAAVLVEGQMDFLMAWQDGVKNVAAASGTALTQDHLAVLKKNADKIILCFDADQAGLSAAERAIDLAAANDFDVKVVSMPGDLKDPAEVVEKKPGFLKTIIASAKPAKDFYFERYLSEAVNKKTIRVVLAKIKGLASSIDRASWLKDLSEKTGFSEKDLAEELERLVFYHFPAFTKEPLSEAGSGFEQQKNRYDLIAGSLLSYALVHQNLGAVESSFDYLPALYQKVYQFIKSNGRTPSSDIAQLVEMVYLQADSDKEYDPEELQHCLKLEHLKQRKQVLFNAIKDKEKHGGDSIEEVKQFVLVSKEIHSLI